MQNVELKARCADLRRAAAIARRLGAVRQWQRRQVDTYFAGGSGRLKVRCVSGQPAELIAYRRPDVAAARQSDYLVCPVPDGRRLCHTLAVALEQQVAVTKIRTLYLLGNVRIHLDRVRGLGTFIELEAVVSRASEVLSARKKLDELCGHFGIKQADLLSGSYADLLVAARTSMGWPSDHSS
ncbi:MAG: class IV adenylate cyclase [Candidatus Oleimicrobiaceae bacterium]